MMALASHNTIILIITNLKSTSLHLYIFNAYRYGGKGSAGKGGKGGGRLDPKEGLPEWVVYSDLLVTTKRYLRGVTAIESDWLVGGMFKRGETSASTSASTSSSSSSSSIAADSSGSNSSKKAKKRNVSESFNANSSGRGVQAQAAKKPAAGSLGTLGTQKAIFSNYVPAGKQSKNQEKKKKKQKLK